MRQQVHELQGLQQTRLRDLDGTRVHCDGPPGPCPKCGTPMRVRKTSSRLGLTLSHGSFRVRQTECCCSAGCTEQTGERQRPLVWRSPQVARLLMPHSRIGYDLLCFVGQRRFLERRQREEIRDELKSRYGIEVSAGEVSELCGKFCSYLGALHRANAGKLRRLFDSDGGWLCHFDATGEDGRGTLLVVYAGGRDLVLGAWKIPTERTDAILRRLRETAELFGAPRSLMHDLGRGGLEASKQFLQLVASQGGSVVDLVCHMHFVADIGKDLLAPSHDALRLLFRRFKVAPRLRAFVRDLGRKLGTDIDQVRHQVDRWFAQDGEPYQLPAGKAGLGVVRAMAQWALDWAADGGDKGFPFDRPWHDFFVRCAELCRAVEAFLGRPHRGNEAYRALSRLFHIVLAVRSEVPFGRQASILASRARLLDELRRALRLHQLKPTGRNEPRPLLLSPREAAAQLRDIKADLRRFVRRLRRRQPARGLAKDTRAAIATVLAHLDRYGPMLFGHIIKLPAGGFIVAERTNVVLECLFHDEKHGMRRCSGRKNLGQNLEHLPGEAFLARNLRSQAYLDIVCGGSLDHLPAAFASLDEGHRNKSLPARQAQNTPLAEIVCSSLPTVDRKLVRTDAVSQRLLAAARSRSVRLA